MCRKCECSRGKEGCEKPEQNFYKKGDVNADKDTRKVVLITGGTDGLGKAAAHPAGRAWLSSDRGGPFAVKRDELGAYAKSRNLPLSLPLS